MTPLRSTPLAAALLSATLSTACAVAPSAPASAPVEPAPVVAAPTGDAALAALDNRRPVPLPPMMALHQKDQMRGHLGVMEAVVGGLAREDWAAIEAAALRLGTSPHMAQTCEHMGAAADGFTEQALDMHGRADAITAAARAKDAVAVLRATESTLQACNACHATWRQGVVSDAEYAQLGSAMPGPGAHGGGHGAGGR